MKKNGIFAVCLSCLLASCSVNSELEGTYCEESDYTVLGCTERNEGYAQCMFHTVELITCEGGSSCRMLEDGTVGCGFDTKSCTPGESFCSALGLLGVYAEDCSVNFQLCENGCANGQCVTTSQGECSSTADCGDGAVCVNGVCKAVNISGVACKSDADCVSTETCDNGFCVPKVIPLPECLSDDECQKGMKCEQLHCVPMVCATNADCSEGLACDGGICIEVQAVCLSDADCAQGKVCEEGVCVPEIIPFPECFSDDECQKGMKCEQLHCVPMVCSDDADCGEGLSCVANKCVEDVPQGSWLKNTSCGADGKSVDFVYGDRTENKTCKELTGFDTECRTFGEGNDGCAMPASCGDVSSSGRCMGNTVVYCDEYSQRLIQLDCSATGMVCGERYDGAYCFRECEKASHQTACVMGSVGYVVETCNLLDGKEVIQQRVNSCKTRKAEILCDENGKLKNNLCGKGSECNATLGYCTRTCTQEGELVCEGGTMKRCSKVGGKLVYEKVSARQCEGDSLSICSADGMKTVNCRTDMTDSNGNFVEARCDANLMGTGMAVCYPVEHGDPCPAGLTEDGRCDGNTLQVCAEADGVMWESDCSQNQYGATQCSVIYGYSDCRQPCTEKNAGICTYDDNAESYVLTICVEDEGGHLVWVQASGMCSDSLLYSCNGAGEVVQTDCSLTGGVCDVSSCVYPACYSGYGENICSGAEGNLMSSCSVREDGYIEGQMLRAPLCEDSPNVCHLGQLVSCQ